MRGRKLSICYYVRDVKESHNVDNLIGGVSTDCLDHLDW